MSYFGKRELHFTAVTSFSITATEFTVFPVNRTLQFLNTCSLTVNNSACPVLFCTHRAVALFGTVKNVFNFCSAVGGSPGYPRLTARRLSRTTRKLSGELPSTILVTSSLRAPCKLSFFCQYDILRACCKNYNSASSAASKRVFR